MIMLVVSAVALAVLIKSGKLNLGNNVTPSASISTKGDTNQLSGSDEVSDIEKDLSGTKFDETDTVLGDVDKALNSQ